MKNQMTTAENRIPEISNFNYNLKGYLEYQNSWKIKNVILNGLFLAALLMFSGIAFAIA